MQMVLTFLASLGPWNWFLLAVVLFGLETIVPGVHFIWFGMAASIAGIFGLATGFAWQWQLVLFAATSMATVFWLRRAMTSEQIASDVPGLNDRGHQFVGRSVTVEEAIEGGRGRVRIGDSLWAAEGPDAGKGARMKVTGVKGTVLVVEPG